MRIKIVNLSISSVVLIVLLILNILTIRDISEYTDMKSVNLYDENITADSMINALEGYENPNFTLWKNIGRSSIYGTLHLSAVSVDIYNIYGEVSNVFPCTIISGGDLQPDDFSGCVIDSETSYLLYGSTDSIGQMIEIDGRNYFIRGVFDSGESFAAILSHEKSDSFNHVEIDSQINNTDSIVLASGADKSFIISPIDFYDVLKFLNCLTIAYVIIFAMIVFSRHMNSPVLKLAVIAAGLALLFINKANFPQCLIPSRWSDFEFYSECSDKFIAFFKQYLRSTDSFRSYKLAVMSMKSVCFSIVSFAVASLGVCPQLQELFIDLSSKKIPTTH